MAKLEDKKIELKMVFETEEMRNGKKVLYTMTVKNINPEVSDDDLYNIANEIKELQKLELVEVNKKQNDVIVSE